ncbi:MAG: extracellular solute-binding protein [Ruminococcus sp.]|nr:extracellular solute-binding protein [Ruminococcus sp.]
MKKIIALVLAAMMLVAVFAGCGEDSSSNSGSGSASSSDSSSANAGKGFDANVSAADFGSESGAKLKVWGPDAYIKLLTKQCDAFKEKFADQKISIEVVPQSEDTAATMMQTDAKAGADVFGFASDQFSNLINAGILSPINAKYAADIEATNDKSSVDISKSVNNTTGKEALYAYPETGNGYFLVYDKSVVSDKDAGSLETILDDCKAKDKKFIMDVGNGYYACMFIFTGGLRLEGTKDNKQLFNKYDKDEVAASMKAFSKLMHKYKGTFMSDAVTAIPSGFTSTSSRPSKVGAGIDGNWDTAGISKALGKNFGAAKLPTINIDGKDTQIYSMYGYKSIGVNANSKYPRTAQILGYYLSSEECQKQRAEELGWSPTNNTVVESDVVKNDVAISALIEQSKYSIPQANVGPIWDPFKSLGNKLLADDTDPDTFDFAGLLDQVITNING